MARLIHIEGKPQKLDINKIIAEAKSQGYKLRKYQVFANQCLLHYDGSYYRIPLIDISYGIIADGGEAEVYHGGDYRKPLIIKNDIGLAMIMPINRTSEPNMEQDDSKIIIEVDIPEAELVDEPEEDDLYSLAVEE